MLGNVDEWREAWKGAYPNKNHTDPQGPDSGLFHVIRGGSRLVHSNRTRSYFRNFMAPNSLREDVRFTIVAVASG